MIQLTETPLVRLDRVSERTGNEVYAKLENTNPTGSHKDRESLAIIRDMLSKGAKEAVIASKGNAAISLSALEKLRMKDVTDVIAVLLITGGALKFIKSYKQVLSGR